MPEPAWPDDPQGLITLQDELRPRAADALRHDPFRLPTKPLIGGCFVAFARGEAGPGRPGDRAFAAAVVWEPGHEALLRRRRGGIPARSEGRALRGSHRLVPALAAEARQGAAAASAQVVAVPRQGR
ncbi:MAG: hypothetical protein AB1679_31425 [Actinomycetota bacterium]|jgi:hypothetical protein